MEPSRDQMGPSGGQVGAKWGPSGPGGPGGPGGPMGYPKNVVFSLVLMGFLKIRENDRSGWPRSAKLAGTPCDSLKSLLEPLQCTTVREKSFQTSESRSNVLTDFSDVSAQWILKSFKTSDSRSNVLKDFLNVWPPG